MVANRELSDVQWAKIERLLPSDSPSPRGGRRRLDDREVMEGILWALRSGALEGSAARIPVGDDVLASTAAVGRRWRVAVDLASVPVGTRRCGPARLARGLRRRHVRLGKKGGSEVGKTKRGKGTKLMVAADGQGVPLGVQLASASPHESTLIESTLEQVAVPRAGRGRPRKNPERLIYDRAADNDALRARLKRRGIELICPNRSNKRVKTQDGRPLRRYR